MYKRVVFKKMRKRDFRGIGKRKGKRIGKRKGYRLKRSKIVSNVCIGLEDDDGS